MKTRAAALAAHLALQAEHSLIRALAHGAWTERATVLAVTEGLAEMHNGADGPYRVMTPLGEAVQKILRAGKAKT
jgi:hypothetical protein